MVRIKQIKQSFFTILLAGLAGYFFIQCSSNENDPEPLVTTPENALHDYLNNGDETYGWQLENSFKIFDVTVNDLLLSSQKWHSYTWKHQLTIIIPDNVQSDEVLLWITGGSMKNGEPKWANSFDDEALAIGTIASTNQAITAILRHTPNQPLFNGLSEDALISYTLNEFKNDGDYSWPLLFPMVKSAVRAMDAIGEYVQDQEGMGVSGFLIAGASKRGWTTWLTGAADNRVLAIAPAVIDMVNMPVNLDYQLEVWGDYSEQIQDYVDLGIPQDVHSQQGAEVTTMIDPYSYRDNLTMPKMIFIGTNDPYWPVDAVKHYFDDLPGENFIHYVANAGHDLNGGEQAIMCLSAFFSNTIASRPYAACSWDIDATETDILLEVTGSLNDVQAAYLWSASSTDRDFRNEEWSPVNLEVADNTGVNVTISYPNEGYRAFYVDLEYIDLNQNRYTISTRMFVTDENEIL